MCSVDDVRYGLLLAELRDADECIATPRSKAAAGAAAGGHQTRHHLAHYLHTSLNCH